MFWDEGELAEGELLVRADLVTREQLDEAVKLAGNKRLNVGQMLVMAGYINPSHLYAAVDAVSMLRNRTMNIFQAQHCLKLACKTGKKFEDLAREFGSEGDT